MSKMDDYTQSSPDNTDFYKQLLVQILDTRSSFEFQCRVGTPDVLLLRKDNFPGEWKSRDPKIFVIKGEEGEGFFSVLLRCDNKRIEGDVNRRPIYY